MLNKDHVEMKKNAKQFADKWMGRGYEKGETQKFWIGILDEIFGLANAYDYIIFEDQINLGHTSFIDARIPSTSVLIEQKSLNKDLRKAIKQSDGTLLSPYQQAKRYNNELPHSERARWIVISNFKEIHIYDMEKPHAEAEVILLENLEEEYYRLNFLIDKKDQHIQRELEVSLKAGQLVGQIYDALLKEYANPSDEKTLQDLNQLCVRLVFCFYAEDAGLFGKHSKFHDYLIKYKDSSSDFRDNLIKLFDILNTKEEERDPYANEDLLSFPYVNGGLFENTKLEIPRLNSEIIDIILNQASSNFDWSKISPTIFGGVFESTLNPATRRSGGMHYTSIKNIHKVIDPLFMNDLRDEFDTIKEIKIETKKNRALLDFQNKLASLTFLDPASGSGNFLTETFIQLRKLENEVLKILYGDQIFMGQVDYPIKVTISQFYGIEINDFAATVAKTALWIAESQMFQETQAIIHFNQDFLPLKSYPNITIANALRIDWQEVVSRDKLNYIMGNPPFVGASNMNKKQKKEVEVVFSSMKKWGNLDYVASWFKLASKMMNGTDIKVGFVSTNSICQGEQANILWKELFNDNISINFAHRSFVWDSEASEKAHVHVVIIGFSKFADNEKYIFENERVKKVKNINAYLVEGDNIFIDSFTKPLSNVVKMIRGSSPCDNGNYSFTLDEKNDFISKNPELEKYIRKYIGSREFINGIDRYCIWLEEANPIDLAKSKELRERINNVVEFRLSSKKEATRELAKFPLKWEANRYNGNDFILIPRVSSEKRRYIPIGFMHGNTIANDSVQLVPNATLYEFGILTSNVHMAWMRVVAGRLKSDYRYSNLVYNSFIWPSPTEDQKEKIKSTAQAIIDARKEYYGVTLAELYSNLDLFSKLYNAHLANNAAVMEAYGFDWRNMTESECVAELMKLYKEKIDQIDK